MKDKEKNHILKYSSHLNHDVNQLSNSNLTCWQPHKVIFSIIEVIENTRYITSVT